jgi:hypothetical protein
MGHRLISCERILLGSHSPPSCHLLGPSAFPLKRLHNWYITAISFGVMNITFEIPGNTFYNGATIGSIDFEDLWFMFHQKWLNMNLLVVWCL